MNPFFRDTATIARKELKQLGRDPLALVLTIMFPILLIGNFIVIRLSVSVDNSRYSCSRSELG